jgi:hypothetical protein
VRHIDVADDQGSLDVLWHSITEKPDETREIHPFQLSTIDLKTHETTAKTVIGQRIYYAAKRAGGHAVIVGENGKIRTLSGSAAMNDEGTEVDPHAGISSPDQPLRVRHEAVRHGTRAYLSVEGFPSRVLEVNLETGAVEALAFDRAYSLRGLDVTADGTLLVANVGTGLIVYDLEKREIRDRIDSPEATTGVSISSDGAYVYTAQVVDEKGGAVHAFSLATAKHAKKVHLDDISPWALAVRPR